MALNCDAPHRGRPPQRPARPGSSSDVRPPVLQTVSRAALVFAPCRFTAGSSGESRLAQPAAMHPKGHPKALKQSFRPSQTKKLFEPLELPGEVLDFLLAQGPHPSQRATTCPEESSGLPSAFTVALCHAVQVLQLLQCGEVPSSASPNATRTFLLACMLVCLGRASVVPC